MPVAIIMPQEGAIPALLMEDTAIDLVKALAGLSEAPPLEGEDAARIWIQGLPAPSGWFNTLAEASAHVKRIHQPPPILSGRAVQEAREALGMSRAVFASALGMGGNDNTRHKSIFDIENEALNKSSGKPRILNPSAVARLKALMAENQLKIATK